MKRDFQFSVRMAFFMVAQSLLGIAIILGFASSSWAQLDGTGLTGTVTDATARVVPDVQVMAVQDSTGLRRETVSSGQGTYELTELPVGSYTVSFSLKGFETLRFESVVQSLGQTRTLNVTLKIAGAKEELEVLSDPPSLDQTADTWGTGIERIQAEQLPLDGRDWATLTTLVPRRG
jgi:hypothetical protein